MRTFITEKSAGWTALLRSNRQAREEFLPLPIGLGEGRGEGNAVLALAETNLQSPSPHPALSPPSKGAERKWHHACGRTCSLDVIFRLRIAFVAVAILAMLAALHPARAYPPAPYHTLYGLVRDQWGRPLDISSAQVFIETTNGASVKVGVAMSTEPGINYRLNVPLDSGATTDAYAYGALSRNQLFRLKVKIGSTVYLPMEMALHSPAIGQPAQATRLDLTLGEDTDGDGLPDGWERALIAVLGGTLASITPDGDADGDGISNLNEYLAGTYPFDPSDGFALKIVSVTPGNSILRFMAIKNRTYSVEASSDLHQWMPVQFRLISGGTSGPLQNNYQATEAKLIDIAVPTPSNGASIYCFRGLAQ